MNDLISRQAAIESLHMHLMYRMGTDSNKKRLDEWINNLPPAQPDLSSYSDKLWRSAYERGKAEAQRMRGRWMLDNDGFYVCDQCGEPCAGELMGKPRDRFCKWCGAKMNGGEQDG